MQALVRLNPALQGLNLLIEARAKASSAGDLPPAKLRAGDAAAPVSGELNTGKLRTGDAPTSPRRRSPQSHELLRLAMPNSTAARRPCALRGRERVVAGSSEDTQAARSGMGRRRRR
jgi:hypothetical protein